MLPIPNSNNTVLYAGFRDYHSQWFLPCLILHIVFADIPAALPILVISGLYYPTIYNSELYKNHALWYVMHRAKQEQSIIPTALFTELIDRQGG